VNGKRENRVEKIVADLLRGRRLKLRGGDAEEKEAITAAARLAAARQGPQRMRPEFRRRLARELEASPDAGFITRRAALVAGLSLAAGAAGGGFLSRALETHPEAASDHPEAIEPLSARWIDVGALADMPEGQGTRVTAGGVGAFVFRQGDGVTAVSSICSHLPCELSWQGAGGHLLCSCHPARFSSRGQSVGSYPLPALNPVHARVTAAGRVEVLGTE
jgi:nitrite reductase/ring-hydroxylating ferredoxin subunit